MKRFAKIVTVVALVVVMAALAVGLCACAKNPDDKTLRFAAPDGTPALAMLTLASQKSKLGDYDVNYDVVSPNNIGPEMASGKADIVIMPINVGATQIVKNGVDYKLVAVAVDGSLFLVGHKDGGGDITIDDIRGQRIACIGETGVPGLVFKYVMAQNGIEIIKTGDPTDSQVFVDYVPDGSKAALRYDGGQVKYIVVGEPAATAQKNNQNNNINAEMDIQKLYAQAQGEADDYKYPQAGLFVKSSLLGDEAFVQALFEALEQNKQWIAQNHSAVAAKASEIGSTTPFPPSAIDRCAVNCAKLAEADVENIVNFLSAIDNSTNWAAQASKEALFKLFN